jgi:hypothetical protein
MNLRFVLLICLGILATTTTVDGEASLFTFGYDSKKPDLRALDQLLVRSNRPRLDTDPGSGIAASTEWLWTVPPLRWIWLNTGYNYYAAANSDGARFRSHALEVRPDLYVDLFPVVIHLGAGATLINAQFKDSTGALAQGAAEWLYGTHAQIGAAWPLRWQLGIHGQLKYQFVEEYRIADENIGLSGWSWRLGLAFVPDDDTWLLNWDWF